MIQTSIFTIIRVICVRDLTKGLVSSTPQSRATCVTPGPKGVGATSVTARSQGF